MGPAGTVTGARLTLPANRGGLDFFFVISILGAEKFPLHWRAQLCDLPLLKKDLHTLNGSVSGSSPAMGVTKALVKVLMRGRLKVIS